MRQGQGYNGYQQTDYQVLRRWPDQPQLSSISSPNNG